MAYCFEMAKAGKVMPSSHSLSGKIRMRATVLAGLAILVLIGVAGCGGGGDDSGCTASPSPFITSTPPTTAVVGQNYIYSVDAQYNCWIAVCSAIQAQLLPAGASAGSGWVSWTPSPSQANGNFKFKIATMPDSCGHQATQSWTVHVSPDVTPPLLTSTSPANGSINWPPNTNISAYFSEPIDPATINASSFFVNGPGGLVAGGVATVGTVATFTPSASLQYLTTYVVTITTSIKDVSGNALSAGSTWTFTTGPVPPVPDTSPPSIPSGMATTLVSASEIDFSWSPSIDNVGVTGYKIFQNGNFLKSVTNSTAASVSGLNFNTQYCYTVSAYDGAGNESAQSNALCVTTLDFLPGNVAVWGFGSPRPLVISNLSNVTAISGDLLALKTDGTVWDIGVWSGSTIAQVPNLGNVVAISTGNDRIHSLALKSDGTVWAWGFNAFGQLGNGTNTDQTIPVQVSNLVGVVTIAGGGFHSLALKSDGTVWAWGYNNSGQLGDGTNFNKSTPVQVANLANIVSISAGHGHSIAIKSDGTIWAWGYNGSGQLGDGTTVNKNVPVQVSNLVQAIAVSSGNSHSLALRANGTVWAWGDNSGGQLGDGTMVNKSVPVQALNLNNVVAVIADSVFPTQYSLALTSNGNVWTWGGTTISTATPAQVTGLSQIIAISAGLNGAAALR
jgi:alpha-tubulin suppressor-like RCC1 family protein